MEIRAFGDHAYPQLFVLASAEKIGSEACLSVTCALQLPSSPCRWLDALPQVAHCILLAWPAVASKRLEAASSAFNSPVIHF